MKEEMEVLHGPYGLCGRKVTLKKKKKKKNEDLRAQELCERRGGRPGLPVPISPYGLCGRKATLKKTKKEEVMVRTCMHALALTVKQAWSGQKAAWLMIITAAQPFWRKRSCDCRRM